MVETWWWLNWAFSVTSIQWKHCTRYFWVIWHRLSFLTEAWQICWILLPGTISRLLWFSDNQLAPPSAWARGMKKYHLHNKCQHSNKSALPRRECCRATGETIPGHTLAGLLNVIVHSATGLPSLSGCVGCWTLGKRGEGGLCMILMNFKASLESSWQAH